MAIHYILQIGNNKSSNEELKLGQTLKTSELITLNI